RYLTPVFALLWVFAPAGTTLLRGRFVALVLTFGFLVQLAALSVDPHRLYLEKELPASFYVVEPWLYFHPAASHLVNRPREIAEVLSPQTGPAQTYSPVPPSHPPTFAFPVIDKLEEGPQAIARYHVLNAPRPWWISQQFLPPEERPVALLPTVALLLCVGLGG